MRSIKTQDGFTLVELMITMVVFVLAMVAASQIFTGILSQFKQQSSIASSNIEGIGGLELLRHDVEQAGFGLFWNFVGTINYTEAVSTARYDSTNTDAAISARSPFAYNDATGNAPRAVVVGNNVLMNSSDVLVIKATNVATNATSQRWEYIVNNGSAANYVGGGSTAERLSATDYATIINPSTGSNVANQKVLVSGGSGVQLNNSFSFNGGTFSPFEPPASSYTAYVAYGVSATGPLGMPFNRADFYVKQPADTDGDGWPDGLPRRCQPNTGILYKATINHADGLLTELPLLDCVLDMQVVLAVDTGNTGSATDWWGIGNEAFNLATAGDVRAQVKEIRIYLIVQEGQRDLSYTYVNPDPAAPTSEKDMVYVKDPNKGNVYGTTKNGYQVPDLNYRWKLHRIVITPYNL